MSESRHCAVCSISESQHRSMEAAREIRHKFSVDGELVEVAPPAKQAAPKNLVAIPDPALRALLLEKGLITYEELARKEVEILGRKQVPTVPRVDG